jgi:hypothetical protein
MFPYMWGSAASPDGDTGGTLVCTSRNCQRGYEQLLFLQAHNLKVTGSNPVPATKNPNHSNALRQKWRGVFAYRRPRSTIGQQNEANCDSGDLRESAAWQGAPVGMIAEEQSMARKSSR